MKKENPYKKYKSERKSMICICPTCHKEHRLSIYWSGGNYKPRMYCETHRESLGSIDKEEDEIYQLSTNNLKK